MLKNAKISHILLKKLKMIALERDITLEKLLEEIITKYLKKYEK